MQKTFSFKVSGIVQGVFFRQSTRERAKLLGITGWVRNLPDGSVEGQATGEEAMLETLREWLRYGPIAATVLKLGWTDIDLELFHGFIIRWIRETGDN